MIDLFSKGSLIVLESLSFTKTLYAFDFDGTLSKIVRKPSEASILPSTAELLRDLSELVPVAVISGRSVDDLRPRLRFKPRFVVGNHGLEGIDKASFSLAKARQISRRWAEDLKTVKFEPGVEIEDKDYSLALHYRRARNKRVARSQIQKAIEGLSPSPRVIQGKFVYNVLPAGAPHKGAALLDLLDKCRMKHILYIGDDDTDEDVFNLPYDGGQLMTIRIGKKNSSQANYYIRRQTQINQVLRLLVSYHRAEGRGRTPRPE